MRVLAIDPGSAESGWLLLEAGMPTTHGTNPNEELAESLRVGLAVALSADVVVTEWMSPRGMPTSAQELEACWWAGRFAEALHGQRVAVERLTRDAVKLHLTGRRNAKDTNVRAALIDRFGGTGGKAAAVGLRARPGPLFGISGDVWAALAVAVSYADGLR